MIYPKPYSIYFRGTIYLASVSSLITALGPRSPTTQKAYLEGPGDLVSVRTTGVMAWVVV